MKKNFVLFCHAKPNQVLAVTTRLDILRRRTKEFVEDFGDELGKSAMLWIEVYNDETAELIGDLIDIDGSTDIDSLVL